MPGLVGRGPVGGDDGRVEFDVGCDAIFVGGVRDIFPDRRPIGNGLRFGPRFEVVTQRMHVAVRSNARIAKQVPSAANCATLLEYLIAEAWTLLFEMNRGADAGKARSDDENVGIGMYHDCFLPIFSAYKAKK